MILGYFSPRVNDICHYLGGRGITYKFWPDVIRAGLIKRAAIRKGKECLSGRIASVSMHVTLSAQNWRALWIPL